MNIKLKHHPQHGPEPFCQGVFIYFGNFETRKNTKSWCLISRKINLFFLFSFTTSGSKSLRQIWEFSWRFQKG